MISIITAESGGCCTFCGARVGLRSGEASEERPPAAERRSSSMGAIQPPVGTSQQSTDEAGSQATARTQALQYEEAVALRDRLVEYDRTAAKRTAVVDDQSDFFEIDSNEWLTREVSLSTSCTLNDREFRGPEDMLQGVQ